MAEPQYLTIRERTCIVLGWIWVPAVIVVVAIVAIGAARLWVRPWYIRKYGKPPTVVATGADGVTSSTAILRGEVVETGSQKPRVCVLWSPVDVPHDFEQSESRGGMRVMDGVRGKGEFEVLVEGLTPSTRYVYRVLAKNDAGAAEISPDHSFTTSPLSDKERLELVRRENDARARSLEATQKEGDDEGKGEEPLVAEADVVELERAGRLADEALQRAKLQGELSAEYLRGVRLLKELAKERKERHRQARENMERARRIQRDGESDEDDKENQTSSPPDESMPAS